MEEVGEELMSIKIVSYYTPNYAEHAERLIASLKKYEMDYDVVPVNFKGWRAAVCAKPAFILKKLKEYSNYDAVVWVDADAEIKAAPSLLFGLDSFTGRRSRRWS